ncbi:thiamine pyrophosphate-dependent enzyme [Streptomyces sp. NPDC097727]|uniref:thiamine pyrophosphate-dependent enzyme n=1 Tax=Streptomyces sp. NPDC097727 TaxID=3366092 RepID=UPI003830F53D
MARTLDRVADRDAVFTVDVGSPVVWTARCPTFNGRRRLLSSFNHGTMACALPHAVGAAAGGHGGAGPGLHPLRDPHHPVRPGRGTARPGHHRCQGPAPGELRRPAERREPARRAAGGRPVPRRPAVTT